MATIRSDSPGLVAAGRSETGRRDANEDRFVVDTDTGVFAVADGMGGHRAGDVAAEITTTVVHERVVEADDPGARDLQDAVAQANVEVHEQAQHPDRRGMGTTVSAVLIEPPQPEGGRRSATVAHVGDSRCYLLRQGTVYQLTRDHTFVNDLVEAGVITTAEARTHPHRNVLVRALGVDDDVDIDLYQLAVAPGDRVVLTTDGVHDALAPDALVDIVGSLDAPEMVVDDLVAASAAAGSRDNITAVVVDLTALS